MRQSHKTILIWAILILMFVSIYSMFTDGGTKERDLEGGATAFQQDLKDPNKAKDIQQIRIEPRGHDDARYVITYKTKSEKSIVNA